MQQQASQRELISPPWLASLPLRVCRVPRCTGWQLGTYTWTALWEPNRTTVCQGPSEKMQCGSPSEKMQCGSPEQPWAAEKQTETSSILIPQVRDLSIFGPLCFPTKEGARELHSQPCAAMESEHLLSIPWRMLAGLPWWFSGEESTSQCRGHSLTPGPGRLYMPWGCVPQPESLRDAVKTLSAATKTQGRQINK